MSKPTHECQQTEEVQLVPYRLTLLLFALNPKFEGPEQIQSRVIIQVMVGDSCEMPVSPSRGTLVLFHNLILG